MKVKGVTMATDPDNQGGDSLRLALRPREAAKALGIGERLLWSLTDAGQIPHLRLGRAVVYPVDTLRQWLTEQATGKPGDQS